MKIKSLTLILLILFLAGLLLPPLFFGIHFNSSVATPTAATPFIIPLWEQAILFTAAFIIKPLYMTISLVIAFMLWRRTETELNAISRGMILFFLGELACAGNYLIFHDRSLLMEYWHNYGMVCSFAFFAYAFVEAFDKRLVHYSDEGKKCALLSQCGSCYKQRDMSCTMRIIFLYIIPALFVVAAMPLAAPIGNRFYTGLVFGQQVMFGHPLLNQMVEVRFIPAVAAFYLLLSFGTLLFLREKGFASAKILVALGLGPLLFSLMRFICFWGYGEHPLWADVWEEITEFLFIVILFRIALLVRSQSSKQKEEMPLNTMPAEET